MSKQMIWTMMLGAIVALTGAAFAQDAGGGGNRAARGGFRNMTPEQMQQRIEEMRNQRLDRTRDELGFTEDEWALVKPLYQKVEDLNRQMNSRARGMNFGNRGGRRGGDANAAGGDTTNRPTFTRPEDATPLGQARQKLSEALRDENTPAANVKAALDAYRAAKLQVQKELDQARQQLREVLSVRQEALLVSNGTLE